MSRDEDAWQKRQLATPVGLPGSGARRYAAAMYFCMQGQLSPEVLEIYRRCCKDDAEDPRDLARFEGLPDEPAAL